jgi:hypothetical protein
MKKKMAKSKESIIEEMNNPPVEEYKPTREQINVLSEIITPVRIKTPKEIEREEQIIKKKEIKKTIINLRRGTFKAIPDNPIRN